MKVLLVEDDNFFQKFYATKLRDNGLEVDMASDGEEGLQKIREQHFDLILLDLVMPKIDGFEVLRTLSEDEQLKSIPVIVFSTLGQESDVEKAKQLGARDYVNKTFFSFDDLLAKIKKYFG